MGDKWETSVKSCGPEHAEWETSVGDKQEKHVKSCGPEHSEWEASVGDKRETHVKHAAQSTQNETQVWETSGRQV